MLQQPFLTLPRSIAISLVVHLCIIAAFYHQPSQIQKREALVIEVNGVMSKKQVEEKKRSIPSPPKQQTSKPTPKVTQKRIESVEPTQQALEKPLPKVVTPPPPVVQETKVSNEEQKQQTITKIDETALMQQYSRVLSRKLHQNISYPLEARAKGYTGIPTVRFKINADGSADSISIEKSSGVELLDKKAIEAVMQSSPFPKPPHPFKISIEVDFSRG